MTGMAENATSTGRQAGAFGEQIDGLAAALKTNNPSTLAPMLDIALAGVVDMKPAAQVLEQRSPPGAARRAVALRLPADVDEVLLARPSHLLIVSGLGR